jgi:EAL domain-containing protein (putative c-di-GMP-specific phosphodiesterase class I)
VNAALGTVTGVEALLRWQHSSRGLIMPEIFIPMLEETGLIIPVGEWVLQHACMHCKRWHDNGHSTLRVSVNLSMKQFRGGSLLTSVRRALKKSGLPARFLELELTESVLVNDAENALSLMNELKKIGVWIAIDDFGTGYSSLSYLKRFPIHMLKIDRSFIHSIQRDHADLAITESINQLGKNLGKLVIAEGVENWAQFEMLRTLGCDMIQGFLFSKPLPVDALTELLERSAQNRLSWTNRICWRHPYPGQDAQPNMMR